MTRANDNATDPPERTGTDREADPRRAGRHGLAVELLEAVVVPVVEEMGFELLLLEWLGSGKRRVLRIFLDSPAGVSIGDCTRMSRVIGNALDAHEAAAVAGQGEPGLAALLDRAYELEVSSPGVDRPLTKRTHFERQLGDRVRLKTWDPLELDGHPEGVRSFSGRLTTVELDPERADDLRAGFIVIDDDSAGALRLSLAQIRRANLVWEG